MIDVPVLKHKTYDCFQENIIAPVCHFFERDIHPAFYSLFDFYYIDDQIKGKPLFEVECVSPYPIEEVENKIDTLLLYSGVKIEFCSFDSMEECREIIEKKLNTDSIVGLCIDSYYLPWNKYYKILHRKHFLLLMGIDSYREYVCYDANISQSIERIHEKDILLYIQELVLCKKEETYSAIDDSIVFNMLSNRSLNEYTIKYQKMNDFANLISDYDISPDELKKFKDINLSPLFFAIVCLGWCRKNYYDSIIYLSEVYDLHIFDSIIYDLKEINDKWETVKILLIKGFIKNKNGDFLKNVGNIIREIATMESGIVKELYNKVKS